MITGNPTNHLWKSTHFGTVAIVIGLMNARPLWAQSVAVVTPQFEVASIKQNAEANSGTSITRAPGGLTVRNYSARLLIQTAYHVESFEIAGVPGWANSEHYDIFAKADGRPTSEQVAGPMLQALLEDRFKLKIHREIKELSVYALTAAKNGFKLQQSSCAPFDVNNQPPPPKPGEKQPNICGSVREGGSALNWTLDAIGISLPELARNLSLRLDRTVLDKTGIDGRFDVHLEYARDMENARDMVTGGLGGDPALASVNIFTSVQDHLGLKLSSSKGPVEILVIDHIEKPSEN
jgi:uncharacterized protein (TIGR03435 family)